MGCLSGLVWVDENSNALIELDLSAAERINIAYRHQLQNRSLPAVGALARDARKFNILLARIDLSAEFAWRQTNRSSKGLCEMALVEVAKSRRDIRDAEVSIPKQHLRHRDTMLLNKLPDRQTG